MQRTQELDWIHLRGCHQSICVHLLRALLFADASNGAMHFSTRMDI
jgi:hypothetical protein